MPLQVPSLLTLCIEAVKDELLAEDDIVPYVNELPSELFDYLLPHLPPLALQKLQEHLPVNSWDDSESANDIYRNRKKRKRFENFETVWKALYESRWPREVIDYELINDWQQMYWEAHLQTCLNAGVEIFSVPSFDGLLGEIQIPDALGKYIGHSKYRSSTVGDYSKLSYHCEQFGIYARCLRLQNVLCVSEISHLLRKCKLQSLELHWIKSKEHLITRRLAASYGKSLYRIERPNGLVVNWKAWYQVDGLCKLLCQNRETLTSVEFVHCKLSADFVNAICHSLNTKGHQTHSIKNFSIKRSILDSSSFYLPDGLASFLSSARFLSSLNFSDNHLRWNFAKLVFDTLLDASSSIAILDLSDNRIDGCFSHFKWSSSNCSQLSLGIGRSLQSLRVLNLRSNNLCKDDVDCLKYALVHMPNLEVLDLSDNPIEDGIRNLISYFAENSERGLPLVDINLEKCELSCDGVTELFRVLSTTKKPLKSLSIGHNNLGSKVGEPFGKLLCAGIQTVNIEEIGLGSLGFLRAREEIIEDVKLVSINMSNNRGGTETANFLSRIVSRAPELVQVNAGYNCMPVESVAVISSCLKVAKGKLKHLDLTGNYSCHQLDKTSPLDEFQINGKPIVILQFPSYWETLYDHDP